MKWPADQNLRPIFPYIVDCIRVVLPVCKFWGGICIICTNSDFTLLRFLPLSWFGSRLFMLVNVVGIWIFSPKVWIPTSNEIASSSTFVITSFSPPVFKTPLYFPHTVRKITNCVQKFNFLKIQNNGFWMNN